MKFLGVWLPSEPPGDEDETAGLALLVVMMLVIAGLVIALVWALIELARWAT